MIKDSVQSLSFQERSVVWGVAPPEKTFIMSRNFVRLSPSVNNLGIKTSFNFMDGKNLKTIWKKMIFTEKSVPKLLLESGSL